MDKRKRDGLIPMLNSLFQTFKVHSHWILDEDKRLDAGFYGEDVIASRVLLNELEKRGIKIKHIEDCSDKIFWPGRFKRKYTSKKDGNPFLMPSECIMFLPQAKKYIIDYPENILIKEKWLLITRSGTIGRCLITTKLLTDFVLSDDLIRIVPKDEKNLGYFYAYLNSKSGRAFLTKNQYGATVKHIEPQHVASIPIPIIPEIVCEINEKILETHNLREEAQEDLLQAKKMLYSELGLPEIDEESTEYFGRKNGDNIKSFTINASELNLRLDASYHLPIIRQIEKILENINVDVVNLGDKIKSIFIPPRFKRPYAKSEDNGTRYIRPSDLLPIKYFEQKYLMKSFENCELYELKNWEVLIVTDGTVGWSSIVTPLLEGWYGSNNFARIVPKEELDRGYLLAYLLSPYGQYQLKREIFGGVIDHLVEDHITQIKIAIPEESIQKKIGKLVIDAYIKKDKANKIENDAIELLEDKLKKIANKDIYKIAP